jgi:hypothetical protein
MIGLVSTYSLHTDQILCLKQWPEPLTQAIEWNVSAWYKQFPIHPTQGFGVSENITATFAHILVYTWCTNVLVLAKVCLGYERKLHFKIFPLMIFHLSRFVNTPLTIKFWYSAKIPKTSESLCICVGHCFVPPKQEIWGTKCRLTKTIFRIVK